MKYRVRDKVLDDFERQLEVTDFENEDDMDNSYQHMITQLDIHFNDKPKSDKTLTKKDVEFIKDTLDNLDITLKEAYEHVVFFLKSYKCKMTYNKRRQYFNKRLNKDPGVYIMKAIDIIMKYSGNTRDDYDIATELGMCNSEALDFLDAYMNDNGWVEDKEEE